MGKILERILLDTELGVVIMDPNADYVNLGTLLDRAETDLTETDYNAARKRHQEYASEIHVLGSGRGGLPRLAGKPRRSPAGHHPRARFILMRMNSAGDIAHLSSAFSAIPPSLIGRSATFGLGEGLAWGRIAPDPLLFKTGSRITPEGGSDVPAHWLP